MPLSLIDFSANECLSAIQLLWQVNFLLKNDHFFLERRAVDGTWEVLYDFVNLSFQENFKHDFLDNSPLLLWNYYRIRIISENNNVFTSDINTCHKKTIIDFVTCFPNPFNNLLTVTGNQLSAIIVKNNLGEDMTSVIHQINTQDNEIVLNFSDVTNGVYYVQSNNHVQVVLKVE